MSENEKKKKKVKKGTANQFLGEAGFTADWANCKIKHDQQHKPIKHTTKDILINELNRGGRGIVGQR